MMTTDSGNNDDGDNDDCAMTIIMSVIMRSMNKLLMMTG